MSHERPAADRPDQPVESLWLSTTPSTDYDPLSGDRSIDVVVVGGGITGLTAAIHLKEAGRDVAVVESDRIVEGVSGYTTAKLTSQHGLQYDYLRSRFGRREARQYARANEAAIDEIEGRVRSEGIDCDFERVPAYTYAPAGADIAALRSEADAAAALGLPASYTESTDLPFDVAGAVRFDDQAQFHPRTYLLAVAESVHGDGSHVFEETRALDLDPGSPCVVSTDRGDVAADDVVVASHFPFSDLGGYFARMHPKQAYLLAVRVSGTPPRGMYYGTDSPPVTLRSHPAGAAGGGAGGGDDQDLLLVGGQGHPTGASDVSTTERYRRCEAFAREHFDVEAVEHRWSTHDYYPVDRVPFVGRLGPLSKHVYVGTGFGGWGMTGGTAAGMILADLVESGSHPWADVFDPGRVTPVSSAKRFLEENAKVGGRFLTDWALSLGSSADLPAPGEATVSRSGGRPVGLHRDEDGELHAVSAVCPHMKCVVRWNDAERTWDCPCHGSRFTCDGDVIAGPALEGLADRTE